MNRKIVIGTTVSALIAVLIAMPAVAQKNYTDGGDLYGGAHAPAGKEMPAKQSAKAPGSNSGHKFAPYSDGAHVKAGQGQAKKLPDERPQPDDVAKSGKFDPYSDGMSK